jgi:cholesterol transport system auxiliary component
MTLSARPLLSVCALIAASSSACALTSRSEPLPIRYFTLENSAGAELAPRPTERHEKLELRLGRIDASGDLSHELAVRTGANELSYRDDQRWTEKPEQYLRRGLERALFQERGLTRAYTGRVPTLDVELVELAEVEGAPSKARVRALLHLHDERRGLCDQAFEAEQPIAQSSQDVTQAVAALSTALQRTVGEMSDRVVQCLATAEGEREQSVVLGEAR